jgi:hypothetical protein
MISRKELTGRLRTTADRMSRYKGPLSVTIPNNTVRTWERELRRLEAAVHALPDMQPVSDEHSTWHRQ